RHPPGVVDRDGRPAPDASRHGLDDLPDRAGGAHQHHQARRPGREGDRAAAVGAAASRAPGRRRRPRRRGHLRRRRARRARHARARRDARGHAGGLAARRWRLPCARGDPGTGRSPGLGAAVAGAALADRPARPAHRAGGRRPRPHARHPPQHTPEDRMTEPTTDAPIRVALVDDQQLVRAGFALVINSQPDMEVVLEAGDGAQALRLLGSHPVDVVLMDVRMPTMDGLAATAALTGADAARPTKVIILTTFDLDEYVLQAIKAGASGFLLKDTPPEDMLAAIRT